MKAEEIKLAFSNNQKFELAISNEIESYIDKGNQLMADYNDLQKQADLKAKMAFNNAKQAIELSVKAVSQAKELGVPTTFFDGRLTMAKDLSSRSSKAKIIIL